MPNPTNLKREIGEIVESEDGPDGNAVAKWHDGVTWKLPAVTNKEVAGWRKRDAQAPTKKGVGKNAIVKTVRHKDPR